jgi:hypothetical protein
MHTDAAALKVQTAIKDLTLLPPEQCVMAAFTVTGMIVGGLAVSHDLPDSEVKTIMNLGQKAMYEVIDQVRGELTKNV